MKNSRTISLVAKEAGVHIETLRYYERRGLLQKTLRSASNYRIYSEDAVKRVRFIKKAQQLGFSLNEIKELLLLRTTSSSRCIQVRKRAQAKIGDIQKKIQSLRSMEKTLVKLVDACSRRGSTTQCPILESLDSENE